MKTKEHGLTVGELTMAVGALLVASLIWTTVTKKENSQDISNAYTVHINGFQDSLLLNANYNKIKRS